MSACLAPSVGFIGTGKMASAIIKGLISTGYSPAKIFASDISEKQRAAAKALNINVTSDNREVAKKAASVIVAVKPYDFSHVLSEIKSDVGNSKPVISIAGGLKLSTLERDLNPGARVLRVMPNVCSAVRESVSAIAGGTNVTSSDLESTKSIFDCVGMTIPVKEQLFDAFSAVAGCGPAFIFPVIEALADGGVFEGLARDTAMKLAAQMVLGSAKLVLESQQHPGELKDSVCSPGGSTIAGVRALEEHKVRAAFMNAVIAASQKSQQMGKE